MRSAVRILLLLFAMVMFAAPARAAAWVETTVLSSSAIVEVERDGRATIRHTVGLRVRGGPLKTWTLHGVDGDAEPLPEAYVVSSSPEKAAYSRRELMLARGDDESLRIDIADDKGLRQGSYLLQFAYRTDFRAAKMARARGGWLELAWVGPRFVTGLDGAKVTFRIPAASSAPRVAEVELEPHSLEDQGAPVDSFVSTVRRGAQFDEVELIRAHVAQGEPVLWRVWANPSAFDAVALPTEPEFAEPTAPSVQRTPRQRAGAAGWILVAGVAAHVWIVAFTFKLRRPSAACPAQGVRPRALLGLHPVLRIAVSGALVSAAILAAWVAETPNVAVGCGIVAMLLAAQRAPGQERTLRGPGVWLPLTDSEAFAVQRPILRARLFDASLWQGRLLLVILSLAAATATYVVARRSSYDAALLALLLPVPLPLFVTALSSQLPHARTERKRAWLCRLHRRLSALPRLRVIAWARFPEGHAAPDELRLKLVPAAAVPGLLGVEIAYTEAAADELGTVTLIVRAKEGSPAQRVWQDRLVWHRGRRAEERVAAHDLEWPLLELTVDAVSALLDELSDQPSSDTRKPSVRSNASKSSGSGSRQSKAGSPSSPRQVMRRA